MLGVTASFARGGGFAVSRTATSMTRRTSRAVALLVALCTIACTRDSESYTDRQHPVALMGQFPSYCSEEELTRRFTGAPLRTVVRENLARSATVPAFTLVELTAAPYTHLGFSGGLMFEFLNDRLASVSFFTQDLDGYVAALKRNGVDVRSALTAGVNPVIVARADQQGRRYVRWQDARLEQQKARWVERYSR